MKCLLVPINFKLLRNKRIRNTNMNTQQSNGFTILGKTADASPQSNSSTPRADATAWAEVLPIEAISLDDAAAEIKEDLSFEISPADAVKLKREQKLALKRVLHEQDLASGVTAIRRNHPLIRSGSPSKAQASAGGGTATPNPRQALAATFRPVTGGAILRATGDKLSASAKQRDLEFARRQQEKERRKAEKEADPKWQVAQARTQFLESKPWPTIVQGLDEAALYIADGITDPRVWKGCNFELSWVKNGVVRTDVPHAFTIVTGCNPDVEFQGIRLVYLFQDGRLRPLLGDAVAKVWATETARVNKKSIKPVRATVGFNELKGIVKLDLWALTHDEIAARKAESDVAEAARTAQAAQDAEAAQAAKEAEEARLEQKAQENPWGSAAGGGH